MTCQVKKEILLFNLTLERWGKGSKESCDGSQLYKYTKNHWIVHFKKFYVI